MKNSIERFRKIIRFLVVILISREFAFVYCIMGTFVQIAHTYFLSTAISSFDGWFKPFQATVLSGFISSSLLYYVSVVDNSDTKENKRNKFAVNLFMIVEIMINIYYYSRHLIIDSKELQIFDFIFALILSNLIPVTIKLYASQIRAKEWFDEIMNSEIKNIPNLVNEELLYEEEETEEQKLEKQQKEEQRIIDLINTELEKGLDSIKKLIEDAQVMYKEFDDKQSQIINDESIGKVIELKFDEFRNNFINSLDSNVTKIFEKNQQLFLQQFENRAKLVANKVLNTGN